MLEKLFTQEQINNIKTMAFYRDDLEALVKHTEELLLTDCDALKYADFCEFRKSGDRQSYEKGYFLRRWRVFCNGLLFIFYGEEKYKVALEEAIWCICGEYTWAVPAHLSDVENCEKPTWIDLFAAETGSMLSEVLFHLEDKLSPEIVEYAHEQLNKRIIKPYKMRENNKYWWETSGGNWTAVCVGSVGMTLMYESSKKDFLSSLPRMMESMNLYIDSFPDDDCCTEGFGYWNYGFAAYVYFSEMLFTYTDGKTDLFSSKKVHNISLFASNVHLGDKHCVPFADTDGIFVAKASLMSCLSSRYDDIAMPSINQLLRFSSCVANRNIYALQVFRDFAWLKPYDNKSHAKDFVFYEKAQWYIRNTKAFSFAAKGGTNDEPHNHNDLGSFIFIVNNERILDDFGMGRYTRQYFSDKRYEHLVTSSYGHSVPIVNNQCQMFGSKYRAKVISFEKNSYMLDLTNAYDVPSLKSLTRRFEIKSSSISIIDNVEFLSDGKLTERFCTYIKPIVSGNIVTINNCSIAANFKNYKIEINTARVAVRDGYKTAYLIDYILKSDFKKNQLEFAVYNHA